MKSFLLAFLLAASGLAAQERYVTVTLPRFQDPNSAPGNTLKVTNSLVIVSGETIRLVSLVRGLTSGPPSVRVERDGVSSAPVWAIYNGSELPVSEGTLIVSGPAKLFVEGYGGGMATFKITPDQYPPDRTVVVPGGPGGATVTMESSTNLVHWTPDAGGVYTNLPGVRFFRIKLDRIQP